MKNGHLWVILIESQMSELEKQLDELAEILRTGPRIAVLTGAGISAESGIPTFRGKDGLWRQFRAEELLVGEDGNMSQMVREAVDVYISKRRRSRR